MCLLSVWRPHILPLDHQILINSMIWFPLKWWIDTNWFIRGMFIHPPDPSTFLSTDASHYGWGLMRLSFHGPWTEDQSQLHNNILEIMAIRFTMKKAIQYIHRSCGMISTDNTTVVSWLSWMRRPTGDQEVAGSTPAEVGNILSWRLIMKYFLRSFSPFRWFKKGSCQFLAKECAQYWLTA